MAMSNFIKYFVGTFPVVSLLSLAMGNPYLSIIFISVGCLIAIPISFVAVKSLALGEDTTWAITSLCCSSTAAIFGLIGIGLAISESI